MFMLSFIFASVASEPSASSVPLPLFANTLVVIPPVELIGVPVKSSAIASIVGGAVTAILTVAVSQTVLSAVKQI